MARHGTKAVVRRGGDTTCPHSRWSHIQQAIAGKLVIGVLVLLHASGVTAQLGVSNATGIIGSNSTGPIGGNSSTNGTINRTPIPLLISNNCGEMIWPGVGTQNGIGPALGGFALNPGESYQLYVSSNWQGRVWGRTNCSFNADGSGPSTPAGVNGKGAACLTGDCMSQLNCVFTGQVPSTLAEFNLMGGINGRQTFYDLSLVDGYNLPIGLVYIPARNTTWVPPNLTNCACIATAGYLAPPSGTGLSYTNSTYPIPYQASLTNEAIVDWCPWNLQEYPPNTAGGVGGTFPYPDEVAQRPVFDPCLSACAASGSPADCCTGAYNDASKCERTAYSLSAKEVCPDAYSFAFDDQTSTFIVPSGGGWQVNFCPEGRSTNIIATFGTQLQSMAAGSKRKRNIMRAVQNYTYTEAQPRAAAASASVVQGGWTSLLLGLGVCVWFSS